MTRRDVQGPFDPLDESGLKYGTDLGLKESLERSRALPIASVPLQPWGSVCDSLKMIFGEGGKGR